MFFSCQFFLQLERVVGCVSHLILASLVSGFAGSPCMMQVTHRWEILPARLGEVPAMARSTCGVSTPRLWTAAVTQWHHDAPCAYMILRGKEAAFSFKNNKLICHSGCSACLLAQCFDMLQWFAGSGKHQKFHEHLAFLLEGFHLFHLPSSYCQTATTHLSAIS